MTGSSETSRAHEVTLDEEVERFERRQLRARWWARALGAALAALTVLFSAAVLGPRDGVLFRGLADAGLLPGWTRALEDASEATRLAEAALGRGDLASVERAAALYAEVLRVHPDDVVIAAARVRALTTHAEHLARRAAQDRAAAMRGVPPRDAERLRARAHTYGVAIEAILRDAEPLVSLLEGSRAMGRDAVAIDRALTAHRALTRSTRPAS